MNVMFSRWFRLVSPILANFRFSGGWLQSGSSDFAGKGRR
jgi:hypothetical protein